MAKPPLSSPERSDRCRGLTRPLRQRLNQDLASALRGFATAFPRDLVEADLDALCEEASRVWRYRPASLGFLSQFYSPLLEVRTETPRDHRTKSHVGVTALER